MGEERKEAKKEEKKQSSSQAHAQPKKTPSQVNLSFCIEQVRPNFCFAAITIPQQIVDTLFEQTAISQQRSVQAYGFAPGEVPLAYIKQNFKDNIVKHLKELLFKLYVTNFLYHEIREHKLLVAGNPRLVDILVEPGEDALFKFELTLFPELSVFEWKYFPFKAPKRKNYKDLDRQVDAFIDEEKKQLCEHQHRDALCLEDWLNFDICIADEREHTFFPHLSQNFWFKLANEEAESSLRSLFLNRKCGDVIFTKNHGLQEYFSNQLDTDYTFRIEIKDVLPHRFFCFEQFKKNFRIKTNKEMHKKLIEVFSYRNDISQRRAIVEESLKLLLSKHTFNVPNHLVLRQQKLLLDIIKHNPDYNVYRTQKDFTSRVKQLAERQAKESIFIDRLAYTENIHVSNQDVKCYLNLTNRPRMKEFIYFNLPSFKIQGQEVPIPSEEIKWTCLREKTINHVIYHLTKK